MGLSAICLAAFRYGISTSPLRDRLSKSRRLWPTRLGAEILSSDAHRKTAELVSPDGVTFEIGMARSERYPKTGGKPHVTPATLHEDLRRRDFTINALGLSLNRASRGLLLDPTNGMGDLQSREVRTTNSYAFHDSPVRLLRLHRLRVRLGFTIAERTQSQYENAREGQVEQHISPEDLLHELRQAATEPNVAELVQAWDEGGLLQLVTPGLTGAALNIASFQKLRKIPSDAAVWPRTRRRSGGCIVRSAG